MHSSMVNDWAEGSAGCATAATGCSTTATGCPKVTMGVGGVGRTLMMSCPGSELASLAQRANNKIMHTAWRKLFQYRSSMKGSLTSPRHQCCFQLCLDFLVC